MGVREINLLITEYRGYFIVESNEPRIVTQGKNLKEVLLNFSEAYDLANETRHSKD